MNHSRPTMLALGILCALNAAIAEEKTEIQK